MNRIFQTRSPALGFSIVELMVAMTIGLIILLATTAIFVQSKQSHTTQDSLARLQENSRFAMQFLMRDLRMAGYFGCASSAAPRNTLKNSGDGGAFDSSSKIQGSETRSNWFPLVATPAAPPNKMKPGTDAFSLRYFDVTGVVPVTAPFAINSSGPIQVDPASTFQQGEIVAVTDCATSAIFQITGPTSVGNIAHVADQLTPGNFTADLGDKIYQNDAQIARYYYAAYYIGDGAGTQPALFRDALVRDATTNAMVIQSQELVEGIENMQVLYGEDMDFDRIPDRYVTANAVVNWRNVMAMRIGILARSVAQTESGTQEYGQHLDTNTYDVDGDGTIDYWDLDGDGAIDNAPPNDRYQRRIFRTTVLLRNLQ